MISHTCFLYITENYQYIPPQRSKRCIPSEFYQRKYDGYLFQIIGSLDRNEIVDLAMSTKIIDYPK